MTLGVEGTGNGREPSCPQLEGVYSLESSDVLTLGSEPPGGCTNGHCSSGGNAELQWYEGGLRAVAKACAMPSMSADLPQFSRPPLWEWISLRCMVGCYRLGMGLMIMWPANGTL